MIGANAADIATSWNAQEGNPALRVGQGQFGTASVALKSGFVAGSLLIQHVVLRHRPDLQRRMAWLNFAASGGLGAVAVHNSRIN